MSGEVRIAVLIIAMFIGLILGVYSIINPIAVLRIFFTEEGLTDVRKHEYFCPVTNSKLVFICRICGIIMSAISLSFFTYILYILTH